MEVEVEVEERGEGGVGERREKQKLGHSPPSTPAINV